MPDGLPRGGSQQQGCRPSLGAVLLKLQGSVDSTVPPFVGLAPRMGHMHWADNGDPGYLGLTYAPFIPNMGADLTRLSRGT